MVEEGWNCTLMLVEMGDVKAAKGGPNKMEVVEVAETHSSLKVVVVAMRPAVEIAVLGGDYGYIAILAVTVLIAT